MDDLISRQELIEAMYNEAMKADSEEQRWDGGCWIRYKMFERVLGSLPSVQERKKGKWIDYTEDGYVECPFCHSATNCDGNKDELHFCFSCGADMRGEEDE